VSAIILNQGYLAGVRWCYYSKTEKTAICQGFAYQNIVISEDLLFMFRKMHFTSKTHYFLNFSYRPILCRIFMCWALISLSKGYFHVISKRWHFHGFSENTQFKARFTVGNRSKIMKSLYTPLPLFWDEKNM